MWQIACFVLLIISIILFLLLIKKQKNDGRLRVDQTDPEKDLFMLELDTPIDKVPKKKTIVLAVVNVENSNVIRKINNPYNDTDN